MAMLDTALELPSIGRWFSFSPPCNHLGAVKQPGGDVLALALIPRIRLP